MQAHALHYLLYSEVSFAGGNPRWKFVLQAGDSDERFSASDAEGEVTAGRLELLAVVRGLEALDHPSRVTLLTRSRYVSRGIRRDLVLWRERGWRWERFGKLVPIRDHDLWRRIDRALEFHQVECWGWQLDEQLADSRMSAKFSANRAFPFDFSNRRRFDAKSWSLSAVLGSLRRGLLTRFLPSQRPAFTQAA